MKFDPARGGLEDRTATEPLTGLFALMDLLIDRVASTMLERLGPLLHARAGDDDELLSYQQVANLLTTMDPPVTDDVKRPTAEYVASLVARGELIGTPLPGKYRRVRRGDYRAFVARRRTGGIEDGAHERYVPSRDAEADGHAPGDPRRTPPPGALRQRAPAPSNVGPRRRRRAFA